MTVKVNVVGGAMVNPATGALMPIVADKGATGQSAYQAWMDAGNTGTMGDYLESLKSTVAGPGGWSPVLAGEADGTRTLIKVINWTGGSGTKPAVSMYLGTSGYVSDKADAFNFNPIKRVVPMSAVTNAQGVATFNLSSLNFTEAPSVVCLPATMTVLSGTSRSVVTGITTKLQAQVKVDQAALITGVVTLLVGATANILVIET